MRFLLRLRRFSGFLAYRSSGYQSYKHTAEIFPVVLNSIPNVQDSHLDWLESHFLIGNLLQTGLKASNNMSAISGDIEQKLGAMAEILNAMAERLGSPVFPNDELVEQEWMQHITRLRSQEFCFIVDLRNMSFPKEANTDTFFGHHLVNVPTFLTRVHPEFLDAYLRWGTAAYTLSMDPQHQELVRSRRAVYKIPVPVQFQIRKDGQTISSYYWVVQTARPFRLDEQHQMTHQVNVYSVLKKYEEGDMATFKAEICESNGMVTEEATYSLIHHLNQNLLTELGAEARAILESYRKGINSADKVADILGIHPNRVKTVQKSILKYANQWYPWKNFTMAKQFAHFLNEGPR